MTWWQPARRCARGAPRVVALEDNGFADRRDPAARSAAAVDRDAGGGALDRSTPVLVQVPRRRLPCLRWRALVAAQSHRCRHRMGPLSLTERNAGSATCRWCGGWMRRCGAGSAVRTRSGPWWWARRTAEELGRASGHDGHHVGGRRGAARDRVRTGIGGCDAGGRTAGAAGYGAALLLDGWSLLGRQDLRAAEDALRRWMAAAAQVHARATAALSRWSRVDPDSSGTGRWDPVGRAEASLDARADVGLPPSVGMAAVDGGSAAVAALIGSAERCLRKPPDGARRPAAGPPTAHHRTRRTRGRMLIRVARRGSGVVGVPASRDRKLPAHATTTGGSGMTDRSAAHRVIRRGRFPDGRRFGRAAIG